MTIEHKALVLSYVHSSLAVKNLDVALHESKMSKDPDYKSMSEDLKKLKDRMNRTFIMINKKMLRKGVKMETIEAELDDIQDRTWDDPELKK